MTTLNGTEILTGELLTAPDILAPTDPGERPPNGIDRIHWARRDAILTAANVARSYEGTPSSAETHRRVMEIARWIYYGDRHASIVCKPAHRDVQGSAA